MARSAWGTWQVRLIAGLAVGAIISAVDNVIFDGEVSPIVIVAMLFAAAAAAGLFWGRRGWLAAVAVWALIPAAHLAKRLLGLRDTLHPDTYASIAMLAAFSFVIAAVGIACGLLARRWCSKASLI
jgi:hypothetical protein